MDLTTKLEQMQRKSEKKGKRELREREIVIATTEK